MYSIPAPVIKTILDHCDLPEAIVFARVTKRCSTIFRQYREEILYRGEYVNVKQMVKHCSKDFIIRSSSHRFLSSNELHDKCSKMKYKNLEDTIELFKYFKWTFVFDCHIEIKRYFYQFASSTKEKLDAAKYGIEFESTNNYENLIIACYLGKSEKVMQLKTLGDFYIFCTTGYYHLADNWPIDCAVNIINSSKNPLATYYYILMRGHKFSSCEILMFADFDVIKNAAKDIKTYDNYYIKTSNYNALMIIVNKLLTITKLSNVFPRIKNNNYKFTKFLLKNNNDLTIAHNDLYDFKFTRKLINYLDDYDVMKLACDQSNYETIRFMIKRRGREWARQFDHPFIEKYY